tara:strand:- start:242 stop:538 length:297 start_codon:yes stop_codon:yes gene_type:complete
MPQETTLRTVIFKDGDSWVGQCLEYDIGAQANSLEELHRRLRIVIAAERAESTKQNGAAFAGIDPAPKYFHDMWEKRSGFFRPNTEGAEPESEMALCA